MHPCVHMAQVRVSESYCSPFGKLLLCVDSRNNHGSSTPPVSGIRERAYEEGDVVMFGRILNFKRDLQRGSAVNFSGNDRVSRITHLDEWIKRLPARSLEILLGLEHDLINPRLQCVRFCREEI